MVYGYFFIILSQICVCVSVVLGFYCVTLLHSNLYILLYRSYFLQISSCILIYIKNSLILATENTDFSQQRLIPSL